MKRLITSLFLTGILIGCATSYQKTSLSGGYSDTQLDTNVFKIDFQANGYTKSERAVDFALLRSAELTLDNGFNYFVIINEKDHTVSGIYAPSAPKNMFKQPVYSIRKPAVSYLIKCFKKKPESDFSYNAKFTLNSLSKKYKLDL